MTRFRTLVLFVIMPALVISSTACADPIPPQMATAYIEQKMGGPVIDQYFHYADGRILAVYTIVCGADSRLKPAILRGSAEEPKLERGSPLPDVLCGEKAVSASIDLAKLQAVRDFLRNPDGYGPVEAMVKIEEIVGFHR